MLCVCRDWVQSSSFEISADQSDVRITPTVQSGGVKKVRKAKSMPELHLRLVSFFSLLSSLLDQSIDVFETRSGISLVGGVVSD